MTISVHEHQFAFLMISLDFQKRNCEVKVFIVFKIVTLSAKSLSRKATPPAHPQAHVSRSLCVHTLGCYCFYKILANWMGESQFTIVHFGSLVANYVKRSVYVLPSVNVQLNFWPTCQCGFFSCLSSPCQEVTVPPPRPLWLTFSLRAES